MALTKEDLQAIKGIVDESVKDLKTDVEFLKTSVERLETSVDKLSDRVTRIEVVQLENYLIPKVEEISAYQNSVYERYTKDADRFEDKISLIDSIDQTVTEHSNQIQELQTKMA